MNAPTIAPEIQQEVARSLLERLGEKTALVRFFRYNASAKHGVPIDPPPAPIPHQTREIARRDNETNQLTQPTPTQPTPTQPANVSVQLTQPSTTSDYLKGSLMTLATLVCLGAAGVVGYLLSNRDSSPPQQPQQFVQSPFQFLEDMGEHLP